jgi:hypothetical protein
MTLIRHYLKNGKIVVPFLERRKYFIIVTNLLFHVTFKVSFEALALFVPFSL